MVTTMAITSVQVFPNHVGFIMDGNRRWAEQRGLSYAEGYEAGYRALKRLLDHVQKLGLKYLSVYAFSTENWGREHKQVDWLLSFISKALAQEIEEIHRRGLKLLFVGNKQQLSAKLRQQLVEAETLTTNNDVGTLAVCFNYGGQQEIVDTIKAMMADGSARGDITLEALQNHLYTPELPSLDLIIRTSGEHRLSNFMLWRAAYSELYFLDKNWPDFTADDRDQALKDYAQRQRRMGR